MILNIFPLELQRSLNDLRHKIIPFLLGMIPIYLIFVFLRNTEYYAFLRNSQSGGVWGYFAWMFCMGTTIEVCNSLCVDISAGVFGRLVQSPYGFIRIVQARFVASAIVSCLPLILLSLALHISGYSISSLTIFQVGLLVVFVIQCYAMTLISAGICLSQKSIKYAYAVSAIICLPLMLLSMEKYIGNITYLLPISSILTLLREHSVESNVLYYVSFSTVGFVIFGTWVFSTLVERLRRRGTLLFV